MVFLLVSSAVGLGYAVESVITDNQSSICRFSASYAALRSKNTDWLARNQSKVSEWSDIAYWWTVLSES
jgi:hypothetical protein